ncbi:MAG: hypothetical protein ACLTCV_10610 [Oscillospiraceae bacterium]
MNDTQSPQAGSGKVEVTLLDILKLLLSRATGCCLPAFSQAPASFWSRPS